MDISVKIEARLNSEARKKGVSVDTLLELLMDEHGATAQSVASPLAQELPVWHLGPVGSLHRRDIYNDAD